MIQSLSGLREIQLIQMENNRIRLTLTSFGASIFSLEIKNEDDEWEDIAIACRSLEEFVENKNFYGATVGRVVNRIKDGLMKIDGEEYHLTKNEGNNSAHGGDACYARRNWNTEIKENSVVFSLLSKDKEAGYPGNVKVEVEYKLENETDILITHKADTDQKTIFNMTNHIYWCIDGLGTSIYDQELFVNGRFYLEVDKELIPTGQILAVDGTPYDFTESHPIGDHIHEKESSLQNNRGYDVSFVRDAREMGIAARLSSKTKNRVLEVETSLPDVHIYTANFLDGEIGKNDTVFAPHCAICIEGERFPDAVNKTHFGEIFLLPEKPYFEQIRFRIIQK